MLRPSPACFEDEEEYSDAGDDALGESIAERRDGERDLWPGDHCVLVCDGNTDVDEGERSERIDAESDVARE